MVRPRWFLAMWDKKKLDKILIPLLSRRLLMPEHFWNTERFAHDVFRRFWTNKSRRKMWHAFFSIIFFPYWKVSQTQKRSPMKFFGTLRLKFIHGKSLNSSFVHKIFGCPNFYETLEFSPQVFWHCETKTINRNVITLLSKTFCYQNSSETQKGSPTMIFGDVRQKKIRQSCDTRIVQNTFDAKTFLKHRRVRPRWFLAMWDKKIRQNSVTPIIQKVFDARTILKHRRVRPRCSPAVLDKQFPTEKPLLLHNFFPYWKISQTQKRSQWSFSVVWD